MTDVHDRPIPAPEERHDALVAVVPPFMLRTPDNPAGMPIEVFDGLRAASPVDRSQMYRDLAGHRNALECIAAFSATESRKDLDAIDVPTLVIHGDDNQIAPFEVDAKASAARIAGATFTVYPGAPHGITDTHKELLGADLLAFVNS